MNVSSLFSPNFGESIDLFNGCNCVEAQYFLTIFSLCHFGGIYTRYGRISVELTRLADVNFFCLTLAASSNLTNALPEMIQYGLLVRDLNRIPSVALAIALLYCLLLTHSQRVDGNEEIKKCAGFRCEFLTSNKATMAVDNNQSIYIYYYIC